ncbi:uncharacterized protein DFL_000303 [Arthrobotrys flagrans]|uniref:Uncharacterized protein n=1 Tax=Arthrobotrys flagrans TaxID=97331 RepID=A0A437AER7_ARTFL|nr:hypothetical protein DFL_000303 [Arthrobotrys flagrans]
MANIVQVDIPVHVPDPFRGFNPHESPREDLDRVGYPPRPDPNLSPQEHALWEYIAKRNHTYVHAVPTAFQPSRVNPSIGLYKARNWSGGVLPVRPQDDDYELYTWVGLDGWENNETHKVGVVSGIKVEDGKIVDRYNYAAIFLRDRTDATIKVVTFDRFIFEPGDIATGYVGHV